MLTCIKNVCLKHKVTNQVLNCWQSVQQHISVMLVFQKVKVLTGALSSLLCLSHQHFFWLVHVNVVAYVQGFEIGHFLQEAEVFDGEEVFPR